jgi:hypothetical protein
MPGFKVFKEKRKQLPKLLLLEQPLTVMKSLQLCNVLFILLFLPSSSIVFSVGKHMLYITRRGTLQPRAPGI